MILLTGFSLDSKWSHFAFLPSFILNLWNSSSFMYLNNWRYNFNLLLVQEKISRTWEKKICPSSEVCQFAKHRLRSCEYQHKISFQFLCKFATKVIHCLAVRVCFGQIILLLVKVGFKPMAVVICVLAQKIQSACTRNYKIPPSAHCPRFCNFWFGWHI